MRKTRVLVIILLRYRRENRLSVLNERTSHVKLASDSGSAASVVSPPINILFAYRRKKRTRVKASNRNMFFEKVLLAVFPLYESDGEVFRVKLRLKRHKQARSRHSLYRMKIIWITMCTLSVHRNSYVTGLGFKKKKKVKYVNLYKTFKLYSKPDLVEIHLKCIYNKYSNNNEKKWYSITFLQKHSEYFTKSTPKHFFFLIASTIT